MSDITKSNQVNIPNKRKEEAKKFWEKVKKDLDEGMTPDEIASTYINKRTGKKYTREHIFWIIRQINNGRITL